MTAAVWCGVEISVVEAQGAQTVAFSSSHMSHIFLFTGRSATGILLYASKPDIGTFGSVSRCQVLLENKISISVKLVSRRKHEAF